MRTGVREPSVIGREHLMPIFWLAFSASLGASAVSVFAWFPRLAPEGGVPASFSLLLAPAALLLLHGYWALNERAFREVRPGFDDRSQWSAYLGRQFAYSRLILAAAVVLLWLAKFGLVLRQGGAAAAAPSVNFLGSLVFAGAAVAAYRAWSDFAAHAELDREARAAVREERLQPRYGPLGLWFSAPVSEGPFALPRGRALTPVPNLRHPRGAAVACLRAVAWLGFGGCLLGMALI